MKFRLPAGKISKIDYQFDQTAWDYFGTDEDLHCLVAISGDAMEPRSVKETADLMLAGLQKALVASSSDWAGNWIAFERNQENAGEPLDAALTDAILNLESPWYWDGLLFASSAPGIKILLQPESDGIDVALYLSGEKATQVFNSLKANLQEENDRLNEIS